MTAQPKKFDFSGFGSVEAQNLGHDVHILRLDGTESGMVVTVAGPDSDQRKRFAYSQFDAKMKAAKPAPLTAAGVEGDAINELVAATIGWRFPEGFDGPAFSADEARKIYTTHGYIRRQVAKAADDLANFTKA